MTVTKRRDRLVVFRLTDEELEVLRQACMARGGRSLSDFARSELLGSLHSADLESLQHSVSSLAERVSSLESRCDLLSRSADACLRAIIS